MTYTQASSHGAAAAPFRLDAVEEVPAPQGCVGVWHRYVITQGGNTIVGLRAGIRGEVDAALGSFIERLNARFTGQRSKR